MILYQIIFILITFKIVAFFKPLEITVCYDNSSILDKNIKPKVFDVIANSTVHIWCHYCNAKEDYYPKLWFYKQRGIFKKGMKEIQANNNIEDKVSITLAHTLNINYFNPSDSGVYSCKSYEGKPGDIFTFVLDGVVNVEVNPKNGAVKQWQEYKRIYIDSINTKFQLSKEEPFHTFRNNYGFVVNVYTIWDNWSECKVTTGNQKGIRRRFGRCRLGLVANSTAQLTSRISFNTVTSYLSDEYDVPCRSLILNETEPAISKILRNIPEFEAEETCSIPQKEVMHKKNKEISMLKTVQQVMENSHVTLFCNEAVNSEIKWFKDKKLLKSIIGNPLNKREDEPHISIDANDSLHLMRISKNDEGIYTCSINGKKVKQIEVIVISKSKLLNQEFIRYSIYLGFVLSVTMTCYCAGVCVAWHRRASFVDPLNMYNKKPYRYSKGEQEKLIR